MRPLLLWLWPRGCEVRLQSARAEHTCWTLLTAQCGVPVSQGSMSGAMSRMSSNRNALRRRPEPKTTRLDTGIRTPLTSTLGGHRTQSSHHLASSLAVQGSHLEPRCGCLCTGSLQDSVPEAPLSVCNLRVTTACGEVSPKERGPAERHKRCVRLLSGTLPCSGHRQRLGFYWLF